VLNPGETLFFRGGDQFPIAKERGSCIVVETGNSEDVHLALAARVL
jgi:hypothetical protein